MFSLPPDDADSQRSTLLGRRQHHLPRSLASPLSLSLSSALSRRAAAAAAKSD